MSVWEWIAFGVMMLIGFLMGIGSILSMLPDGATL